MKYCDHSLGDYGKTKFVNAFVATHLIPSTRFFCKVDVDPDAIHGTCKFSFERGDSKSIHDIIRYCPFCGQKLQRETA